MKEPISFLDPSSYPFVFRPRKQEVFIYGKGVYPVSFKFRENPRHANIVTFALDERDILMLDRDVGNDASVCSFSKDTSHRIELYAENRDIRTCPFHIKVWPDGGNPSILKEGQVVHVKQASSPANIYHTFSMESSTQLFDSVSGLYPTVSLKLYFSPTLRNNSSTWETLILPDKQESMVLMHPSGAYGILDILAELKINWYKNSNRTIKYYNLPPVVRNERFGIRFYILNPSLFAKKAIINENGSAIVEDLLTQESLNKMGYNPADVMYFGSGTEPGDLFFGKETGIKVDSSGLPVQFGNIVPSYLLTNELSDLDFSSSSVSSISSISSLNSSSSSSSISSSSISSLSSLSSGSSVSSSSKSSISSTSSSSTSSSSTEQERYFVNFEDATKTTYTADLRTLNGVEWMLDEAVIGTSASDKKNDLKSLRLRGSTSLQALAEMRENKVDGISTISFYYARYGTETNQPNLYIEYSINDGANWIQIGVINPPFPSSLTYWESSINIPGKIRIRFRTDLTGGSTTTRRLNIEDVLLLGEPYPPGTSSMSSQSEISSKSSISSSSWSSFSQSSHSSESSPSSSSISSSSISSSSSSEIRESSFSSQSSIFSSSMSQNPDFNYIIEDNKARITGYNSLNQNVIIPEFIEDYPVVRIEGQAFEFNVNITNVFIPEGVTEIGYNAFYGCSNLETIDLPDGLILIEWASFKYCSKLTNIVIPNSVINIAGRSFESCTLLESIVFNGDAPNVGIYAFFGVTATVYYYQGAIGFTNPWNGLATVMIESSSVSSSSSMSSGSSSLSSESSSQSSISSDSSSISSQSSKSSDSSTEILPQYICVSGAGVGAFNGTYEYSNDSLYYQSPGAAYEIYKKPNGTWWFDGAYNPENEHYNSTTAGRSPVGLTYQTNSPDLGFSPTISEGECY